MATQVLHFNQAQQAVLNVISCFFTVRQDLADLKRTLVKFMNERLQREIDKLWESGEMSNEKLQEMQSEHLRTAYKLTDYAEKHRLRYQLSLADNCKEKQELFLMEGFLNGDDCLCYTTEILEEYEEILCLKQID